MTPSILQTVEYGNFVVSVTCSLVSDANTSLVLGVAWNDKVESVVSLEATGQGVMSPVCTSILIRLILSVANDEVE